jgi:D-glycerate 3-kinase
MKNSRGFAGLDSTEIVLSAVSTALPTAPSPLILGIAGTQGSGKSTIARKIRHGLEAKGVSTAILSLDDLYFDRDVRARLAQEIHPLFITRGPPGSHNVDLGCDVLTALKARRPVRLPRFDKGRDDQRPAAEWPRIDAPVRVVVFEGWCVGARAQPPAALINPINDLERIEDADRIWRTYVNNQLAGDYRHLFALVDRLIFLRAPSFDVVQKWRVQQERELGASAPHEETPALMSDAEIARFIQHFERITRHMMEETPGNADLTIDLDDQRAPIALHENISS